MEGRRSRDMQRNKWPSTTCLQLISPIQPKNLTKIHHLGFILFMASCRFTQSLEVLHS